jgi:hypothetical protein
VKAFIDALTDEEAAAVLAGMKGVAAFGWNDDDESRRSSSSGSGRRPSVTML